MLSLSIVLALILDRVYPGLQDYRSERWLLSYRNWIMSGLKLERLGPWPSLLLLLLPVLLVLALLITILSPVLFGFFSLLFYVLLAALCLGPRSLDRDVDAYLEAVAEGSAQESGAFASAMLGEQAERDPQAQALQVSGGIFVLANRGVYTVLFWFIAAGPLAIVAYRILERLMSTSGSENNALADKATLLVSWMEWPSAVLSSCAFMLAGNFDSALRQFRELQLFDSISRDGNEIRLQRVGLAAVGADEQEKNADPGLLIKRSRGLCLRAAIAWIAFVALLEYAL